MRLQRRVIKVQGIVQSVGFRPHVHRLATSLGLAGFVQNQAGSVLIEIEGEPDSLDRFCTELSEHPPALAQIESLSCERQLALGASHFQIKPSDERSGSQIFISPDVAICRECLTELFDPQNRRYRYPFINCTNCGPRLTIVTGAPYDRGRTTMASFPMCSQCRAEYDNPADRRYHAEPIACHDCGPRLTLYRADGVRVETAEKSPLVTFVEILRQGKIGALKGLGGFHLVCYARNEDAVAELRRRKHRDEKPFAIMVRDIAAATRLCEVGPLERQTLLSSAAPIILLKKHEFSSDLQVAAAVAPGNPYLGLMLPYTPLHHLLCDLFSPDPVIMTSGNSSDDPIAYRDEDAFTRLRTIADVFLTHDRAIHVRCDDSVTRIVSGAESPIRRSRGVAPQPIRLPHICPCPILAVGGQLKGTIALGSGTQAFLSHHLGDLDQLEAYRAFERDILLYQELFAIEPVSIAHDLHPDYASTRYSATRDLPLIPIQHHHAHMASCMAEHDIRDDVIGVIFDGAGLGNDGAIWGGEFLVGGYSQFWRAAHLRYVGMPGGEQVVREPWRMAVAHLLDADPRSDLLKSMATPAALRTVNRILERQCNAPPTSSMGRLFDAVAAMAAIRSKISYEGQAAMELESLATRCPMDGVYPWGIVERSNGQDSRTRDLRSPSWIVDARPLVREVAADVLRNVPPATIARRFQASVVELIAEMCIRIRNTTGLTQVALSGGVFMNALLLSESQSRLSALGFTLYRHRRVPANDGGLSLGQLAIAARILASRTLR